jgi:hypothetical protein
MISTIDKFLKEKEALEKKYKHQLLTELKDLEARVGRIKEEEALVPLMSKPRAEKRTATRRQLKMSPIRQKAFDIVSKGKDAEAAVLKELKKPEKTPDRFLLRAINDLKKMGKVKEIDGKLNVA